MRTHPTTEFGIKKRRGEQAKYLEMDDDTFFEEYAKDHPK
jgi:hypothetical protein